MLAFGDEFRVGRVHHEDGEKACRFGVAGIPADGMVVAGLLNEALTGRVDRLGPSLTLLVTEPSSTVA